ncbi:MAG: flagellar assembly protein FliW [Planctomycetales bacterium]|nr:flagellar assembly protein FliW [Planctomycetales bacterium]
MDVLTTRFGSLRAAPGDLITFESGLIGLRECRRWLLLADAKNPLLGWLQCVDAPEVAVGVVAPRRFVPEFQLRVSRSEIQPLRLDNLRDAQVAVIVSRQPDGLSLNLRAPLVINIETRRGRQVISKDALPVQYLLPQAEPLRRSA